MYCIVGQTFKNLLCETAAITATAAAAATTTTTTTLDFV